MLGNCEPTPPILLEVESEGKPKKLSSRDSNPESDCPKPSLAAELSDDRSINPSKAPSPPNDPPNEIPAVDEDDSGARGGMEFVPDSSAANALELSKPPPLPPDNRDEDEEPEEDVATGPPFKPLDKPQKSDTIELESESWRLESVSIPAPSSGGRTSHNPDTPLPLPIPPAEEIGTEGATKGKEGGAMKDENFGTKGAAPADSSMVPSTKRGEAPEEEEAKPLD